MTIQDFIPIWQAQPFRAFRMRTLRGEFVVHYPMGAVLTAQMRVAVVVDDARVETFALDEIESCAPFGEPKSLADAMDAIPAETLGAHAQLLSAAQRLSEPEAAEPPPRVFDPGRVVPLSSYTEDGVSIVHATVQTRDGDPMLSTAGTRWSLHGVEQFENGTSLYLHHLDHPTVEQRIILWPPNRGTFTTFAEEMSTDALAKELRRRDSELAANPEQPVAPPVAYFRKIVIERKLAERDGWAEMFGEEFPAANSERYEFLLVARAAAGDQRVENPCLTDTAKKEVLFELLDTEWDASCIPGDRIWRLSLRHAECPGSELTLSVDLERRGATIDDGQVLWPLSWIERHLRNLELYRLWEPMHRTLLAGPVGPKQPDLVLPLAGGFTAELWAGEPRFPTPFLQPHFIDARGAGIFDLRATTWSAAIHADSVRPGVTLVFSGIHQYPLEFDLVTHRVKCPVLEGWTTIGMIQAMVRRVRGEKWMLEEIPQWLAKGQSVQEAR